jgi:NAD(P)-dependent dehydrogenase (short-subunit alcohol dehydrogenase family)
MTRSRTSLDGLVAIVTGAAGGVGRACVELFAERGASVLAEHIYPKVAQLQQLGDRVLADGGYTAR